jgi:hypothetical protein
MTYLDVSGKRFGRLTVAAPSERKSPAGKLWRCVCDCGGETVTTSLKLRNGHTQSCGCLQAERTGAAHRTHGRSLGRDKTYKTWKEMRRRCTNPNATQWQWYGARGITVCDRWQSFEMFLADMGERPEGTTLDRIDGSRGYEPDNCRWATPAQQAQTNSGVFRKGRAPWNKGTSK